MKGKRIVEVTTADMLTLVEKARVTVEVDRGFVKVNVRSGKLSTNIHTLLSQTTMDAYKHLLNGRVRAAVQALDYIRDTLRSRSVYYCYDYSRLTVAID